MCIRDRCIPGKKNIAADTLSCINIRDQTFEGEKETIIKLYHIISSRADLANINSELERQQKQDPKLSKILKRLDDQDNRITPFYSIHQQILFIRTQYRYNAWKIVIPRAVEKVIIMDYHVRYGQMGVLKVVKVLQELSLIHICGRGEKNKIPHLN